MRYYLVAICMTLWALSTYCQEQVDSTLTIEEIQFRDSIAALNVSSIQLQKIQETYNAATQAFSNSNYGQAIQFFEEVTDLDSTNSDAYYNKGLAHKELKQYDQAIDALSTAFILDSTKTDAIFHQAKCYFGKKDIEKTLGTYDELLKIEPMRAEAAYEKGVIHYINNNYQQKT